ncbi:MAG TPA: glycosyl transferase family protein [Bryobacteraceae bacterium]|nr:glycosyl transferase family protein [Bryobacteraceae bacterium]
MTPYLPAWLEAIDRAVLWCLAPLAIAMLVSGLDDLIVDIVWAGGWIRDRLFPRARVFPPGTRQVESAPRRKIAILVPLWQEHEVIGRMLEHNLAAIRYREYHFFAGAYPNDGPTQQAVRAIADRFANVHLALCPHPGPTSKADCLNWIYQHIALYEERTGEHFDLVVTHDAEDLIHPEELNWMNFYSARFDFLQTPVLALGTPITALTHGVYCDEFAEYHTRDMTVRPRMGGFVPSSGVGTCYRREALEKLAGPASNRIFEPEALTEDYENGLRLFRLGCSQGFMPIARADHGTSRNFVATREFFPQGWASALQQRTRWVMGIALQGWERHGWRGNPGEVYWLWRDRKGLLTTPLSLAANLVFFYGISTSIWTRATPFAARLAVLTLALQVLRLIVRMACVRRVYGVWFALGVPLRAVYANLLNAAAATQAVIRYSIARALGRPLRWVKTEHAYPSRTALLAHKRMLGEILTGSGYLTPSALSAALESQPAGLRLGEHLVRTGLLNEQVVYEALSLQQGLPVCQLRARDVAMQARRALPEHVSRMWRVLPFRVENRGLCVASPELPTPEMSAALRGFTSLELRFHLMTPSDYEALKATLV